jgi:hypothetical protein
MAPTEFPRCAPWHWHCDGRGMRWTTGVVTTVLMMAALHISTAQAQDRTHELAAGAWAPDGSFTECVRPECLRASLELRELEARLGDHQPDETPSHVLLAVGGVITAGGLAMFIGTIATSECLISILGGCSPQVNTGLFIGAVITAIIGATLLVVGGVVRAGTGAYRRRDGLRRRLERWNDHALRDGGLPFTITF